MSDQYSNPSESDVSANQSETPSRSRRREVFAAWWHVARVSFVENWRRSALVLGLSIVNTVAQLAAFAVVILVAQALTRDGIVELLGVSATLPLDRPTLLTLVGGVAAALLTAAIIQYQVALLTAQYRRTFFAELIKSLLGALQGMRQDGRGVSFDHSMFGRMMRRECRYLSRAYVAAISAIPPGVMLIGVCVFSLSSFPFFTGFLILVILLAIPFHIAVTTWGAGVSTELVRGAQRKARADDAMIARIIAHPLPTEFTEDDFERHVNSDDVRMFLDAYRDRMRLGASSQLISGITTAIALASVVLIFSEGFVRGVLDVSVAIFVVIAFRLLLSNAAAIAQSFAVVGSFQPFVQALIDVLDSSQNAPSARLFSQPPEGSVVIVFDPNPLSLLIAWQLHLDFRPTKSQLPAKIVLSNYELRGATPTESLELPDYWDIDDIVGWLPEISDANRSALKDYLSQPTATPAAWANLPDAVRTIFSFKSAMEEDGASIIAAGSALSLLTAAERKALLEKNGRRLLVATYQNAPKRIPFSGDINMYVCRNNELVFAGDVQDFNTKREMILRMVSEEKARLAAAYFQFDEDDDTISV